MKSTSKLLLLAEFSESQIAQIRSSAEATQLNANDVRYGLRIQGALKSKPPLSRCRHLQVHLYLITGHFLPQPEHRKVLLLLFPLDHPTLERVPKQT